MKVPSEESRGERGVMAGPTPPTETGGEGGCHVTQLTTSSLAGSRPIPYDELDPKYYIEHPGQPPC